MENKDKEYLVVDDYSGSIWYITDSKEKLQKYLDEIPECLEHRVYVHTREKVDIPEVYPGSRYSEWVW